LYCLTADAGSKVEFHEAIASMIPLLIKRLGDNDSKKMARSAIAELFRRLANHSEWQFDGTAAQLTRTTKSGFVKPPRGQFHCSLNGLMMRMRSFD
jgi:hypothetical protein